MQKEKKNFHRRRRERAARDRNSPAQACREKKPLNRPFIRKKKATDRHQGKRKKKKKKMAERFMQEGGKGRKKRSILPLLFKHKGKKERAGHGGTQSRHEGEGGGKKHLEVLTALKSIGGEKKDFFQLLYICREKNDVVLSFKNDGRKSKEKKGGKRNPCRAGK